MTQEQSKQIEGLIQKIEGELTVKAYSQLQDPREMQSKNKTLQTLKQIIKDEKI